MLRADDPAGLKTAILAVQTAAQAQPRIQARWVSEPTLLLPPCMGPSLTHMQTGPAPWRHDVPACAPSSCSRLCTP